MDELQAATAVKTWIDALATADDDLPDFAETYTYPVAAKGSLPDLAAVCTTRRVARTDERFPMFDVQGHWLVIFPVEISIMVEVGQTFADAETKQGNLYAYGTAISESLVADPTLGGELPAGTMAAPEHSLDYSEPFIEYADGTRGRTMFGEITVAQIIDEPG